MFEATTARADQQLQLMRRMLQRLQVTPRLDDNATNARRWAEALRRCAGCSAAAECESWLAASDETAGYRSFCPNAALFDSQR